MRLETELYLRIDTLTGLNINRVYYMFINVYKFSTPDGEMTFFTAPRDGDTVQFSVLLQPR